MCKSARAPSTSISSALRLSRSAVLPLSCANWLCALTAHRWRKRAEGLQTAAGVEQEHVVVDCSLLERIVTVQRSL